MVEKDVRMLVRAVLGGFAIGALNEAVKCETIWTTGVSCQQHGVLVYVGIIQAMVRTLRSSIILNIPGPRTLIRHRPDLTD